MAAPNLDRDNINLKERCMRVLPLTTLAAAAAAGLTLNACGRAEAGSDAPAAEAHAMHVTAMNYAFHAPDTVPAGLVRVRMDNAGTELHHTQMVRLDSGRTFQDLAAVLSGPPGPLPKWIRHVGGPGAVIPGDSSEVTMILEPGSYALLCYVPNVENVPHFALGMMRPFVVSPSTRAAARPPAADLAMVLDDYRFDLSGALRAGRQTIEVSNVASQFHEVVFMRMEPGKTALDFGRWEMTGRQGPPPGRPIGGPVGLDTGERNWFTVDLTPGNYSLICFYPDRRDGKPHFEHGMTRDFVIE